MGMTKEIASPNEDMISRGEIGLVFRALKLSFLYTI
jgi:hypothetical protein